MSKGAPVLTNSLYKISDRIAQAPTGGKEDVPGRENQTRTEESVPAKKQPVPLSPERILEFNRMHHDLEIRVEGMLAEYLAENERLNARKNELETALSQVESLKKELSGTELPEETETDAEKFLSKQLRSMELMRLETIRLSKKMDAAGGNGNGIAETRQTAPDLMNIPAGELMKKGFAFFFPLGLAIFLCTILLGMAFIVAWKVAL